MNRVIEPETPKSQTQGIATITLSDTDAFSNTDSLSFTESSANKEIALPTTDTKSVRTTCPYCGVGCGVLATIDQHSGKVSVTGDPDHPANFGKLCSKGSALAETLGTERRITQPYYNPSYSLKNNSLKNNGRKNDSHKSSRNKPSAIEAEINLDGNFASESRPQPIMHSQTPSIETISISTPTPANWDGVLDDIATRLNDTIAEHGRDSVMFYVSGQLLTEDYYVANKFIKGFIGNNNIDSNSRLCMSSAVAGHKRAFGADLVPGNYDDLEACELLVLVGSNMAWCHPILFGRFLKAKQANPNIKLVVIDPRRTDSCEFADLHLPIAAGTDTHLYNGLLNYLEQQGCHDTDYAEQCEGLERSVAAAQDWSLAAVASACDVDVAVIRQFYELVAATPKTVTAFSMGVNQSSSGTDKVNAIINTHLLTGRVGKVGASPFSLTGQPNAMGGREVGALANLLAAHLDLANSEHRRAVADFWQAPQTINEAHGVKACDAADAILDGRIKAIWIMATNPVVSLPEADKFRRALSECELVIVSDCSKDSDTVACADIVLPAQGWGEKSGTVTNSERRISRQRTLLPAVGEAKPDWWILSQVAQRMGLDGFNYSYPSEIFNEHVALTAWRNEAVADSNDGIPRYLNLAQDLPIAITDREQNGFSGVSQNDYDAMLPFQWGGARINMVDASCNMTRAQLVPITPPTEDSAPNFHPNKANQRAAHSREGAPLAVKPAASTDPTANLRLITGRLRDQWHTMTRTCLAPQLNQQQSVPTLALQSVGKILVHPDWLDAMVVQLRTLLVKFSRENAETLEYSQAGLAPFTWSLSRQQDSILFNIASSDAAVHSQWLEPAFWQQLSDSLFSQALYPEQISLQESAIKTAFTTQGHPNQHSQLRFIASRKSPNVTAANEAQVANNVLDSNDLDSHHVTEHLVLAVYIAPSHEQLPSTHWLDSCFHNMSQVPSPKWLLAGRPASGYIDPGPLVCACMSVGENIIINAITEQGCHSAKAVGKQCRAGTNCGSCVGQINDLVAEYA